MKKRIVFMGTPSYATTIFKSLLDSEFELVALVTQPDKPVGRKKIITPPDIKQFCLDYSLALPIFQPHSLKKEESVHQRIIELKPDFIIVAAYGKLLPRSILDIAPCINLHASLLPLYRGASPIQEALLNDDNYTGVTAMLMEEGLDTGDILGYEYIKLEKDDVVETLFNRLSRAAASLTLNVLQRFNTIFPKSQDHALSTKCHKISKEDGQVDFMDAKQIYLKYKAFHSWPGIFLSTGLKLKELILIDDNSKNEPGCILTIDSDGIIVGCMKGTLKVKYVQPPSKKSMTAVEYIRGKRLSIDDYFI